MDDADLRRLSDLFGDFLDERAGSGAASPREILEALRAGTLGAGAAGAYLADLRGLAEQVDPDRVRSFDVLRAIRELAAASRGAGAITVAVAGRTVRLVPVEGTRCTAEVDGEARPIRSRVAGGSVVEEGDSADLAPLLECLATQAEPVDDGGRARFECSIQWGHFRQNRFTRVLIALAADGAVDIEQRVAIQDESYY